MTVAVAETIGVERVRVRVLPDGRMTREDAARYLGVREKTLAQWAWAGTGPRAIKMAGRCFYYQVEPDTYIAKCSAT